MMLVFGIAGRKTKSGEVFLNALKMKLISSVFILISVTVCDAELNLETTDGENVTISFKTAELERADRVRITFTRDNQFDLIAQYCRCVLCRDCIPVETPGVLLRIEEGALILLDVSSRNSGLYEAKIISGKNVFKKNATLVVKPPFSSSRAPPRTSISKPPQTSISKRQRLYVLIAPAFILAVCFFCKCLRGCETAADNKSA